MIELYGMGSPNVTKIAIMLEEAGLACQKRHVSVMRGQNFTAEFLALNPVAKVPVLVDTMADGTKQVLFESGAILTYLGDTYAPRLLPKSGPDRWEALKWLNVQVAWVGPMLGQWNHFLITPSEQDTYGWRRYRDQARNIYRVLDQRLGECPWLAGDAYSVADIATFPWADYVERHGFSWNDYPALREWKLRLAKRPAVVAALKSMEDWQEDDLSMLQGATPEELDRFFGRTTPGTQTDFSTMAR